MSASSLSKLYLKRKILKDPWLTPTNINISENHIANAKLAVWLAVEERVFSVEMHLCMKEYYIADVSREQKLFPSWKQ